MSQVAAIQSAQTVAALRAAVTNETSLAVACQDCLAKHFISLRERIMTAILPQPLIRWALERSAPGSYGFAIARTRCFDEALLSEAADGIQQVVILGAGYDSRALRFAHELKGVRVFEVDHPGTQARKMGILLRSNIEVPKNVQYVPVDFNRDALEAELVKKGFSRNRRTLFLWEGVSYYLQKPVVAGILRFVESCAPGSSIVFDYALRTFVEGDTSTYGGEHIANWLRKIGEPFVFGLNPHEAPHFLGECGLKPVYDIGPEDAEARYLTRKDGRILRRTLGHVRIVHARNAAKSEEPTPVIATSLDLDVAALAAADRMSALSRETDWSGLWFDLIEKESGDYVGMRAAHVPAPGKGVAWHFLTHSSRDGIGALVELMRRGNPGADIPMPRLKHTSQPTRLAQIGALLRLMAVWPRCARWKTHDRAWTPPGGVPRPGTAVAARTLDAEQTRRLEERARAERVSFNSLLLAALGRATQSELGEGTAYWMMPVNMRGPVAKADESANHTAYLRVNVARDATPAGVQATIKRCFANNEHWGSWLFLHIGRVVGHTGMKLIYRTELARWRGCLWAGAFSNLGTWNGCGEWLVAPPVAKSCPLGAGAIVCNSKLALTIDAHASIAKDAVWTEALMDRWIAELARLAG